MSNLLYKTVTADTQVTTQNVNIVGIEIAGNGGKMLVYDEADATKTAANLVSTIKGSAYYHYNNIVFPLPGVRCNGIYADHFSGTGTVYYYVSTGKINGPHICSKEKGILYSSITASAQVATQDCWLVGGDIFEGTIAVYDEDDSTNTATSIVMTMKVGSHRHYRRTILQEPIKCQGLYALSTSGLGTIYYYLD